MSLTREAQQWNRVGRMGCGEQWCMDCHCLRPNLEGEAPSLDAAPPLPTTTVKSISPTPMPLRIAELGIDPFVNPKALRRC